MKPLLLALTLTGCAKKPVHIDPAVHYKVYIFNGSCQQQPDLSLICKARFDPQTVSAE